VKENKDNIDDIFKESSEQQSFKVPESFLEDINKKLDTLEKKKRRGGFWWFALIPVLLIGGYYIWPDGEEENQKKVLITKVKNETKESIDNKGQENDSNVIYEENSSFDPSINGQEDQLNPALSSSVVTGGNVGANTAASIGDVEETMEKIETQSELLSAQNEQETSVNTIQKEKIEGTDNNELEQSTFSERNIAEEIQDKENTDEDSTNSDSENKTITEPINEPHLSQIDTILEGDETNQTLESDTTAKESEGEDISSVDSTIIVDSTISLPVEKNANQRSHEIQVFGSLTGSYSKLSLAPGAISTTAIQSTTMETPLQAIPQFGVGYNFNFNNYSLGTGLLYQKSGESVNYETNTIELQDSVYISGFYLDTIFNPNTQAWDTVEVVIYDTIGVDVIVPQSFIGENRFNWISIPLNFGYRMNLGNFTFIPRVGTSFEFGIGKNNGIYAELIDQGLIEHQANRFVLSYSLQFEIRRNFERFHIFINPYFKSNITPVISSEVQIRKYNSWGLNAGIGISL